MPVIYQNVQEDGEGLWMVVWGDRYQYWQVANTEMEAHAMSEKISFVLRVQELVEHLATAMDAGPDMVQLFTDRTYGSGGANEILDADIASTGLTAADLVSGVVLLQNFVRFCNNDAAMVSGEYRVTVNKVRRL